MVDIISETATDRDMEENEARIIQAARAAVSQTQKERELERLKERERETDIELEGEGEGEGEIEEGHKEINSRRTDQGNDNERERYHIDKSDMDRNDNIGHNNTRRGRDGQTDRDFRFSRGQMASQESDGSSDDENRNDRKGDQHTYFDDFNHSHNMSESLSSSQLRHTLTRDRRNDNSNRNRSVNVDDSRGEEKFDLRAAYRDLHMDPDGLKKRASFSQALSRRPRTVRAESRRGNGKSKSSISTTNRSGIKNLSSRSPSRDRSQRAISRELDPRSSSQDFNSSVSSRFSSPPHTSRYSSYSPLGNTNYFPLRSSASGRPLPPHVPMDLYDRNQAAVGYIVSNNEENYTKALTTAVETVVNDYFR